MLNDRAALLNALLDLDPAVLHCRVPPPSQAIEHAFTYAKTHLLPQLLRIWPMPDDLPHAAGNGDFARVRRWFDAEGKPALGDVANHSPATSVHPRESQWGELGVQQVLDTALAWAVLNNHFDIADFLLAHGADINTNWSSHEPASILHELVWHTNYEAMQFLIDRGIDMTIEDYRWNSTPGVGHITLRTTRRWRSGWTRRNNGGSRHRAESPTIRYNRPSSQATGPSTMRACVYVDLTSESLRTCRRGARSQAHVHRCRNCRNSSYFQSNPLHPMLRLPGDWASSFFTRPAADEFAAVFAPPPASNPSRHWVFGVFEDVYLLCSCDSDDVSSGNSFPPRGRFEHRAIRPRREPRYTFRWPNKAAAIMDAFLAEVGPEIAFPELPSALESLRVQMKLLARVFRGRPGLLIRSLLAEARYWEIKRKARGRKGRWT